jgi:hypothetical protein
MIAEFQKACEQLQKNTDIFPLFFGVIGGSKNTACLILIWRVLSTLLVLTDFGVAANAPAPEGRNVYSNVCEFDFKPQRGDISHWRMSLLTELGWVISSFL